MADYVSTLNLAVVCVTFLAALSMLRSTVRAVAERKSFVFVLRLPFNVRWVFSGVDDAEKAKAIVDTLEQSALVTTQSDAADDTESAA